MSHSVIRKNSVNVPDKDWTPGRKVRYTIRRKSLQSAIILWTTGGKE